jgi:Bcr/CflA subfamily drug resistance transporter
MKKVYLNLAIIGLFACLAQFAIDIYTPSLPAIASQFGAHLNKVQWSVSLYALTLALSMLIYGPLSEAIGRKKPLLFGLLLMLAGSVICAIAENVTVLILGRIVQGLGAGGVAVLWRVIMRDLFSGDELAKYSSYLVPLFVGVMAVAPLFGGYFQHYLTWRMSFVFLCLYAIVCMLLIQFQYAETSEQHSMEKIKFNFLSNTVREILSHRIFIAYASCVSLAFGAYFCWFVMGPVVLIHLLGLTAVQFGWINSVALLTMSPLAGMVNGRLVQRFKGRNMMCFGFALILLSGLILLLSETFFGLSMVSVVIALFILNFAVGFVWVNAFSAAMTPFGHIAGYAATLYAFIQYSGAALISSGLAYFPDHSARPLALVWIVVSMMGLFILKFATAKEANSSA